MTIGTVIGSVWATRKNDDLNGCKLMVVQPYEYEGFPKQTPVVAVDTIGSGVGETVLLVSGSTARVSVGTGNAPIDCVIVGIVDTVDIQ